ALTFAIARAGAIAVPINPVLRAPQAAHILADSGAALLVANRSRRATLAAAPPSLTVEDDWAALATGSPPPEPATDADDLAAILYTSGSTGRAKGVMVSHRNLVVGADSVAAYIGNVASDRILSVLPLSFDAGFSQVTTALRAGARAVLLDYLTPRDVLKAVVRHGITGITGVPPLWLQLADLDWPAEARATLRYLANTGGRMPVATTRRLRTLFPDAKLFLMYGLTEAFRSTYLDPALADERPESIGKAIPNAEILVVRPDGSLTEAGEPGELVHVGPLVAKGYWNDPERTAERFRAAPPAATMGEVAVWSGDTVVRDAEGFLTFVGRTDEMIKTSGNRVSPTEIEEAAYATGAVAEAVALGVADDRLGQAVLLVAAPAAGLAPDAAEVKLRAGMAQGAPHYMLPRQVIWRDALPRNANGKLDRAALTAEFAA
ncbi:MAG: acyl-CoA ligase (AMP-forming), exosortase A system-associated, partial [Alphaproteobacteria bacterium]|nr:acyl-CoA ligase (AMP-forming), exosortase A system-associated [Alphaproteobacteria bacterium]